MAHMDDQAGAFADLVFPDDPDKIFELGSAVGSGCAVLLFFEAKHSVRLVRCGYMF